MVEKGGIIAAAKKLWLWRKIYNGMCQACKLKLFRCKMGRSRGGTDAMINRVDKIMKKELCDKCSAFVDKCVGSSNRERG